MIEAAKEMCQIEKFAIIEKRIFVNFGRFASTNPNIMEL